MAKNDYCVKFENGSDLSEESEVRNFCTWVCDCTKDHPAKAKEDCNCKVK